MGCAAATVPTRATVCATQTKCEILSARVIQSVEMFYLRFDFKSLFGEGIRFQQTGQRTVLFSREVTGSANGSPKLGRHNGCCLIVLISVRKLG